MEPMGSLSSKSIEAQEERSMPVIRRLARSKLAGPTHFSWVQRLTVHPFRV